jgi:hypothetical protein
MQENVPYIFRMLLNNRSLALDSRDSWLLSNIFALETIGNLVLYDYADRILQILRGHERFIGVKRICISTRLGLSNQLYVISSANYDGALNAMLPGYSCFVSPESALFLAEEGNMRICDNINKIEDAFKSQNKKVQRSLDRIIKMGLAKSVSLPIFYNSRLEGYLFINGDETFQIPTSPRDDLMVTALLSLSKYILHRQVNLSHIYFKIASESEDDYIGTHFSVAKLKDVMCKTLDMSGYHDIQFEIRSSLENTLVSHGNLGQILARILLSFNMNLGKSNINCSLDNDSIVVTIKFDKAAFERANNFLLYEVIEDARCLGMKVVNRSDCCEIRFNYDGETDCNYSI